MKLLKQIKKIPREKMIVPLLLAYFVILGIIDYLILAAWHFFEH